VEGNTLQVMRSDADNIKKTTASAPVRELRLAENTGLDPWSARIRAGVVFFALLWLLMIGAMWSRAASADEGMGSESNPSSNDEYSFKWLDPEKKIYVLQNRRYVKANRLMLSLMGGPGFSNAYRNTFSIQPRVSYYFSEQWGFEIFYSKVFNSQNDTYKALRSTGTTLFPVIHEVRSELGAMVQWVPWYAKINVFNSILYFDWYFAGGLGSVDNAMTTSYTNPDIFTTDNQFAIFWSTGHQYHLSENFTVRLDFMGTYYRAPLTVQTTDKVWFSNYDFTFGLGIRL
jgi:outer membrane beta-barrel protein